MTQDRQSPTRRRPAAGRPVPVSTYRLQLCADLTFDDAAAQVPYLARLGVTHLYLSPVLTAAPGSTHGYDVVDHNEISPTLGGRAGLDRLAAAAHERSLGLVLDIVPNHMAVPIPVWHNRALWSVLANGPDSPYASWFDVDWSAGESGPFASTDHRARLCHTGIGTAMWLGTMSSTSPRLRSCAAAARRSNPARPPRVGEISLWSTTS